MSQFKSERVRDDYKKDIATIRDRFGDDVIIDWIERYYESQDVDIDDVMEALAIDYVGTFYELLRAYDVEKPEPNPVEEARQAEMMRLLLDGKEVPKNLRIPASWKRRVN
ncbi:hypothetical protein [Agrobacterium tumefaciens]|uniref:hypothetical protein n=1 Tax=Agrobacterium tumefaciens TaxID=358 RepID=UPI00045B9B53|nr:hypothetical protein [Agrobacterium tumefaciens]CDN91780.1 hypothetical protein BN949_00917 [Agrobacterium tumefaciens]